MGKYHYTECGLDNVFIEGIVPEIDEDGDEVVTIPAINALHAEIARGIVTREETMSAKEVKFLRTLLGYSQVELAHFVGVERQAVGHWERDDHKINRASEVILRKVTIEKLLRPLELEIEEIVNGMATENDVEPGDINILADKGGYQLLAA